jgi:uncharacterized membrane protein YjjP (DUF1212 family)
VVATVLRLSSAYEVSSVQVDITFTSISVSVHRGLDEDPLTVVRVVKVRSADYSRLERLQQLVDRIVASRHLDEPFDVEDARDELSAVLSQPHPYRRWVVTAGFALLSGAVTALFGAQPGMWVVAALSAALVDRVSRQLARRGLASFFNQAMSAAIPTTIAVLLHWGRSHGVEIPLVQSPSLLVISGIIVLLAGLGVLGAAGDAIDGYYVTAGARGMEVLMLTGGIAVGISTVLGIANWVGIPMEIMPNVGLNDSPVMNTVAAMLVAVGFAMTTYTGMRATLVAAGTAGVGWVVFELMGWLSRLIAEQTRQSAELSQAATGAVAAIVVGAIGYAAHRTLRVPEVVIATAGIVSMLPGLAVYRALFWMMEDSTGLVNTAIVEGFRAISIGLGLAAGVSIGGFLARRKFGLDRAAVRATRRSRGAYT